MKNKFFYILICIALVACQNTPEENDLALFVEPYLGWNASSAEVKAQMEKRHFVLDQTYAEAEGLRFFARGSEQCVYTEINKDKYLCAVLPFDTLQVSKDKIELYLKKHYNFVRTTGNVNIYGTEDLKTLVYATSVYHDGEFVWHCVTFAPRAE